MDVCTCLESELFRAFRHTIPSCWRLDPSLVGFESLRDVVGAIKSLDRRSDEIVTVLITGGRDDPLVVSVIVVALLPLLLARCAHDRDRVDEVVGELAIVISEFDSRDFSQWPAKAASRLLDRAWGRIRVPARRIPRLEPFDSLELSNHVIDERADPERVAVNRVALQTVRHRLASSGRGYQSVVRAWNTTVGLVDKDDTSPAERVQLKYARQVLRRCPYPELAV